MNNSTSGIKASYMDLSADPGHDFNRFANGAWIDKTEIPPAYPRWGSFLMLRETALEQVHAMLKEMSASSEAPPGSNAQKIGDFFAAGMAEAQVESLGISPLLPELEYIDAISRTIDLADALARLHRLGVAAVFGLGSSPDFNNSNQVIAHAGQGGLGLPDRDYYLNDDEKSIELRQKYLDHIALMFKLAGEKPWHARQHARAVMRIETALAEASMTKVDERDPAKITHKMSLLQFGELIPSFSLGRYLEKLGGSSFESLNVMQPDYFQALELLLTTVPVLDWKSYLRWHLIHDAASCLSSVFVNETFQFYGSTLQGTRELQPRWKRIVAMTEGALAEAVGQLYVERHFGASARQKMLELVANLKQALAETISDLSWMSEATRLNALKKLDAFVAMIAYPDKWKDYGELEIDRESFLGNMQRAAEFATKRDLEKIGKPVDRLEWGMSPQTVNAYYDPLQNQIVFPAAILQPPFFDPDADDAANYGGIGVVIGHEMTHGFDDQGSKFDCAGNLKDWWTEEDNANFVSRMAILREQFSGFTVSGGKHVNGDLVCGEAAADLGGLKLAYRALQKVLASKGRSADRNGYSDEQRFFIAFAQIWASKVTPQFEQLQVATDPHPPAQFRVNGTLAHMPEFFQTFGLAADCKMMLPAGERCQLW